MRKNDEMVSLAELKARLRRFCEKHRIQRLDVSGSAARGELTGVRPMIETYPLENADEAYARMMSGKAQFRVVLTM